jgi:chromosome segregation protein
VGAFRDSHLGVFAVSFASWRKCDFQIHTPRDPNWVGPRPIGLNEINPATGSPATPQDVDAAREEWARDFVDQCISRGLFAIGITDHHEMVMLPYVQQEVLKRKKSDPAFALWVFPGMELTASGGKQCLILFDADVSEDWLKQAQGRLGIVYADLEPKGAKSMRVTQLPCTYPEIADLLDQIEGLKGKYIVLPNVSQGGNHTVLTDGAHAAFRRMPYVGGYLDFGQTINTLGPKNQRRLSGEDKTWSTRKIYPLPTSDSRSSDYANLGKNDTWIKLAEATAEAIRQAFLGHQSRIRIATPKIPALYVAKVEIEASTILQTTSVSMSPELNSTIGGRGSGKSSFLEYLAFGLGRSCYDAPRDHYSGTDRMRAVINDTLVSKNGRVAIELVQDNASFKVVRAPGTAYQPQITYPNGSTQTATVKELRALFPAVVYSQGELGEIGKQAGRKTQLSDLLQFVDPDYKREDDRLEAEIDTAKTGVRTAIQALVSRWGLQAELRKLLASRDALKQRADALGKTLPKLSDQDNATVANFDKADAFESRRLQASKHADEIVSGLKSFSTQMAIKRDLGSDLNADTAAVRNRYEELFNTFDADIKQLQEGLAKKRAELSLAESHWATKYKAARSARDEVLEKLGAHRTVTGQIIKLGEEVTALTNQIGDVQARLTAAGDPAATLTNAFTHLKQVNEQRQKRTEEWAAEIQELSSGKIKAAVASEGDLSELREALDLVAAKTGSQEATRLRELEIFLLVESVTNLTDVLRTECLSLLYWQRIAAASGEEQPIAEHLLQIVGNTERVRNALIDRMDLQRVEAIATALPKPEITLSYCDGTREIAFEKASEGQRAAALLFMLLEQAGGPLIIDQPEGDLDNRIIAELTDKLHIAKQNRQLVFASHNANIVVNGSSELVAHLDVLDSGERQFDSVGAIDKPDICNIITITMEGGERAFKDRQQKYGY